MIKETNQVFEDVLCRNDTMRRNQEIEEYIQSQKESWIEKERIKKAQIHTKEQNKQDEMDT